MDKSRLSYGAQRGRLGETISSFLKKEVAYGGSILTDGTRLYSYMVVIGEWVGEAIELPNSGEFYSRTTTRHRNMLKDMATSRGIRLVEL